MKLLDVLVIPILMLADYYLTIIGERLSKEKYQEYFVLQEYEINPLWQGDVKKQKLINLRHLFIVLFITGYLLLLATWLPDIYDDVFFFLLGVLVAPYLSVVGRHLNNIKIFTYLKKNPDIIQGKVILPYKYLIMTSQSSIIPYILIFVVIYIFTGSMFVLGGALGTIILYFGHYFWEKRYNKKLKIYKET